MITFIMNIYLIFFNYYNHSIVDISILYMEYFDQFNNDFN